MTNHAGGERASGLSSGVRRPRYLDRFTLPRDTDVAKPVEVVNNLVQPRFWVRRLVQSRNDRIDEFTRQPYDALIFGLDARSGLEHKPRNIDGQTEREDEREQQVDPGAQGKFLPHSLCPGVKSPLSGSEVVFGSPSRGALTDKTGVYLIEPYSNIARVA